MCLNISSLFVSFIIKLLRSTWTDVDGASQLGQMLMVQKLNNATLLYKGIFFFNLLSNFSNYSNILPIGES